MRRDSKTILRSTKDEVSLIGKEEGKDDLTTAPKTGDIGVIWRTTGTQEERPDQDPGEKRKKEDEIRTIRELEQEHSSSLLLLLPRTPHLGLRGHRGLFLGEN